ncbi:uncharacterized protein LOC111393336 isoform X2 [Olea europaea var. sylvestris]|uniref:uncharacterized protein LOC111393336 isoform X2 n=1 Tax=Olea europaea var. sylvestris TaxID=158386 RepID=UPI000C1CF8E1|nr:uncharacterized protein LOC111393336 isoform X2 [Olea europaea var. sylvestris]
MNGSHQNGKNCSFERTFPGCLGRMANFFDLNGAVAGNRLLTDKPHRDGSPLSKSQADDASLSPSNYQIEDKVIVPELERTGSNRKSNATPIKMLIAGEMSKEVDSKHSPSNVVAKLMGLDAIPCQEPDSVARRSHFKGHPRSHSDIPVSYWKQQNGFFEYVEPNECSDVYEKRKKSQKTNYLLDKSPQKGKYYETTNDKKMALVRQKFIEAKHLSMDEKLRQSKQFQDALEVLNSNKDLFLRCLQEPNSLFSQNLYNLQSIPPPPETKRITILRPSKMVDGNNFSAVGNKDGKLVKKGGLEKSHQRCSPPAGRKIDETPTQPTRIVVLKPSSVRPHDNKSVDSPRSESPRILHGDDFFGDVEDDEKQESKEAAKAITQQMRETLHRDETLLSSMFSNGYVGDESSFNKSEIEYAEGNLSDSEVISPTSRHSWDYVNRFGSPYSSSFSRASYSPESSVCREAKKRLSERWAMMTSNGSCLEQRPVRRSSSTLGEMLALSEAKKAGIPKELGSTIEEPKNSDSLFGSEQTEDENLDNSPRNLSRSKSVPVYSAEFGTRLNVDIPDPEVSKEATKTRSGKLSFRGKVSSLFFSRNKKTSKDKSECKDESCSSAIHFGQVGRDRGERLSDEGLECLSPVEKDPSIKAASPNIIGQQGITSPKSELSVTKSVAPGNRSENQDQPSPISVLDPNFEEDEHAALESSSFVKPDRHGFELPVHPVRSNLIDKSPPIGSIARTLPLVDLVMDTSSSYPLKSSLPSPGAEEEWFFFVQTLLSVAGLVGEEQPDSFLVRWHSPESPLDPSLRDKYIDLNEKETLHEAKRRQKRSTCKLVFDCVNAALVDIVGYGPASSQRTIPCTGANNSSLENASLMMLDQVWARMKIWFSGQARCVSIGFGDDNSLVVESVVRKEVVGKGWDDHLRLEMDNLGKEIEGKLLEEIVLDAVVELTGRL